jgi:hypothetical protein
MERSQAVRKNRTADEAYRLGISEDKLISLAKGWDYSRHQTRSTDMGVRPCGSGCRPTGNSEATEGGSCLMEKCCHGKPVTKLFKRQPHCDHCTEMLEQMWRRN